MTTKQATDIINGWLKTSDHDAKALAWIEAQIEEFGEDDGERADYLTDFLMDEMLPCFDEYMHEMLTEAVDSADLETIATELLDAVVTE